MKGDLSIFYFFLSIFSYFSTVDIHSFGYTHTHTFFKGPPKLHFPYQQPFNTSGSAAKIPCSSFIKSSELGFPDFTPDTGFMRIHLPGNGLEGGKNKSFLVRLGIKPELWASWESAKDCICLHTRSRSPGLQASQSAEETTLTAPAGKSA